MEEKKDPSSINTKTKFLSLESRRNGMKIISLILTGILLTFSLSLAVENRLEDKSGLFAVEIDGRWGFIDARGQIVIKPVYDRVGFFSEGLASARVNGKWGFIDTAGKIVIPAQFTYADCFSEGLATVTEGGRFGYIDRTGRWIIPAQFQTASAFQQGLALVETKGVWRFIDKAGRPANAGFINRKGQFIIKPRFDNAYEFHEGWAPVSIDGEGNFINKQGVMMTDGTVFLNTQIFSEGLALVQSMQNGKYGYIDSSGKFIIPPRYDLAFLFREGLAAVSKEGRYGFIDKTGKEMIPLRYEFTEVFIGGLAQVKSGEQWIYIDRKGHKIWPKTEPKSGISKKLDAHIQYDMAGLTQVIIKDGRLKYITSKYRGKNPVAAGGPDDYVRSGVERAVTADELNILIRLFRTSGFLDLKDTYGTDQNDRHYPVLISIKTPEIEKSVLYRSHPNYTAPPAFQEMEAALLRLAKKEMEAALLRLAKN
jgi:hypothetical protein